MLLFSKIYEFYCLYGIEILLSGATGAARQNSYEGLHIFSYKALFPNCSNFFPLFLNSSYETLFTILLQVASSCRNTCLAKAFYELRVLTWKRPRSVLEL